MSTSLSANRGSRERLKLRTRCGWSWCASQMRCTERSEMPAALAIGAAGPVRRFVRRLAAGQRHHARHGLGRDRRLAGLARLVAQQAVDALLGEALLPAPDHRPADADLRCDLLHRPAACRGENDLRPFDMLALPVAIRRDRLQPLPVQRAHTTRILSVPSAQIRTPHHVVNQQNASEH